MQRLGGGRCSSSRANLKCAVSCPDLWSFRSASMCVWCGVCARALCVFMYSFSPFSRAIFGRLTVDVSTHFTRFSGVWQGGGSGGLVPCVFVYEHMYMDV